MPLIFLVFDVEVSMHGHLFFGGFDIKLLWLLIVLDWVGLALFILGFVDTVSDHVW